MREYKLLKHLIKLKYQMLKIDNMDLTINYILYLVNKYEKLNPKDITKFISIKPQALANILNKMEKNGLIIRSINNENKRIVDIRLTDYGTKIGKEYCDNEIIKLNKFIEFLGENDTDKLLEILDRIGEYIEKEV